MSNHFNNLNMLKTIRMEAPVIIKSGKGLCWKEFKEYLKNLKESKQEFNYIIIDTIQGGDSN